MDAGSLYTVGNFLLIPACLLPVAEKEWEPIYNSKASEVWVHTATAGQDIFTSVPVLFKIHASSWHIAQLKLYGPDSPTQMYTASHFPIFMIL